MSNALLRRNSSKQGLQNLMRLTAQRSMEDAEELERERRQRAREARSRRNSGEPPAESTQGHQTVDGMYDGSPKPGTSPSLDEDEGFSDWTQRRRRRLLELSQGGEEDEDEEEHSGVGGAATEKTVQATFSASGRIHGPEAEERERRRRKEWEEELVPAEMVRRQQEEQRTRDDVQRHSLEAEKRKVSYTSSVFLRKEPKHGDTNGDAAEEEVTSYTHKSKRLSSRGPESREAEAILETERRLEKIRQSLQEKESQELEQLKQRQAEAEQELEELKRRREARRRVREEEERRREEEEQQRQAKDEEERRRMREDIERRRMDAAERMKSLSMSSVEGDEVFSPFSPKTPTHKITERTESLNRSLKKSNSFKKTQPLVLLAKIDDKMEQYAHAVENSQEARGTKASLSDLPNALELVASKKNLFEAGEAWSNSPSKAAPSRDTEGLKVGVASLITQWVKSSPDSRQTLSRPSEVKTGDVMQKKNMWEVIGDTSGRTGQGVKGSQVGKKYKFVVTGHGKYEKISVDEENGGGFIQSDSCRSDY